MKMKDPKRIVTPFTRLLWRAFFMLMHLHENPYTKRAGVAGLRARALVNQKRTNIYFEASDV